MHAAGQYEKIAETCERFAEECAEEASRAFFLDAAACWRRMALGTETKQLRPLAPIIQFRSHR
jgi:hypothetical protein